MQNSKAINLSISRPTYAAAFRCIGSDCEDMCCADWEIPVDRATYEKYQQFPPDKLGSVVSQFVSIQPPGQPDALYAQIHPGPSGICPFLGTDRLCAIHKQYGPQLLSATCSIYPRSLSRVAGELEGSLSLSCPEAARNILLAPNFMEIEADLSSGGFRTDNIFNLAADRTVPIHKPASSYLAIRTLLIDVLRDRSRPLWHRLLSIGSLCQRMDAATAEGEQALAAVLEEHRHILHNQTFSAELEAMPLHPQLRLQVVFELSDARIRAGAAGRFQDTFWAFIECIGASENSAPGDDVERFRHAEQNYHRPFFERFPFILENYLVNYIFQNLFPYGREGSLNFTSLSMFEEYIQMTTQFAWVNALLVGVAGRHKNAFAGEHVVQTIQPFTRAVEHYPHVIRRVNQHMKARGLDTLHGMAIMLRS
jgi:lysine-N-methylase